MMERRYFGTDGIRGRVGQPPLTAEFALKLGWAAGMALGQADGARVLIGKDTRRSGYLFESALEAGLSSAGVQVGLLGPVPTPAVAFLTRATSAQAGIVISASHNPHYDNGVKFFSAAGGKLDDATELMIERWLDEPMQCVAPERLGMVRREDRNVGQYIDHCIAQYDGPSLRGMRIVLDCAHGAAYRIAPQVFRRLGADPVVIGNQPDGFNINLECGSTHLDALSAAVLAHQADIGIALDGDADRCLAVGPDGRLIDGDDILFLMVTRYRALQRLRGPVVGTLMSNLGLETALREQGLDFLRAKVGDRHVLDRLRDTGGILGGETSGHTLCLDRSATGDGIVTALQLLALLRASELRLDQLLEPLVKCPQVLINIRVSGRAAELLADPQMQNEIRTVEAELGAGGRVLVRASGTEPLIRVMVEAFDGASARSMAERLADRVRALVPLRLDSASVR